jgi:hypothetical protein
MLQGYIVDPETGKVVAVIRHGEVFRDDNEGAKIATVVNANLYDLSGNLVGRLDGPHAIDVRTWSMPIAVRDLLEGETAHHAVSAVKQKGPPESRPLAFHGLARDADRDEREGGDKDRDQSFGGFAEGRRRNPGRVRRASAVPAAGSGAVAVMAGEQEKAQFSGGGPHDRLAP